MCCMHVYKQSPTTSFSVEKIISPRSLPWLVIENTTESLVKSPSQKIVLVAVITVIISKLTPSIVFGGLNEILKYLL